MRGRERALVACVVLAVLVSTAGVALVGVGSVAAQDDGNATATDEADDVVVEVDDQIRVTSYTYDEENNTMTLGIEHTKPDGETAHVNVNEVPQVDTSGGGGSATGSGSFGIAQASVEPGESIRLDVDADRNSDGEVIVAILTQRAVEQELGGQFVYDVDEPSLGFFEGSASWGLVRLAGLGAAVGVIMIAIGIAWHLIADTRDRAEVEV